MHPCHRLLVSFLSSSVHLPIIFGSSSCFVLVCLLPYRQEENKNVYPSGGMEDYCGKRFSSPAADATLRSGIRKEDEWTYRFENKV